MLAGGLHRLVVQETSNYTDLFAILSIFKEVIYGILIYKIYLRIIEWEIIHINLMISKFISKADSMHITNIFFFFASEFL